MKSVVSSLVGTFLAAVLGSGSVSIAEGLEPGKQADLVRLLRTHYTAEQLQGPLYVGPEFCLACHPSYSPWRTSAHATMHALVPNDIGEGQPDVGILFDGNKNGVNDFKEGLDFNKISSAFNAYKPNAPILSFAEGQAYPYRVTIGQITYIVGLKQGGYYQQRLIARIPVTDGLPSGFSRSLYMLPFAYSPRYQEYASYNPDKWWTSDGKPRIVPGMTAAQVAGIGRSWSQKCIGCHVTGFSVSKTDTGEWVARAPFANVYRPGDPRYVDLDGDGFKEFTGVGCESCHGPGSLHVMTPSDKSRILNPATLTKQQQVWLCSQCHTRGVSVPNGTHDFPYDESAGRPYQVGDDIFKYLKDEAGRWPDLKTPSRGEQQYQAHLVSKHFTGTDVVTCSDCHDPHSGARKLPRTQRAGIATSFENNTVCLSCHAGSAPFASLSKSQIAAYEENKPAIATAVSSHSHHTYNPTGAIGSSNCISCHMPLTAKRDWSYDEVSHTMEPIPPEKTLVYQDKAGMPSSCAASCHGGRPLNFNTSFTNDDFSKWNEISDVRTANVLKQYFGPGGLWWDTTAKGSATRRVLENLPPPDGPDSPGRPD
jgi:hypothetical protein